MIAIFIYLIINLMIPVLIFTIFYFICKIKSKVIKGTIFASLLCVCLYKKGTYLLIALGLLMFAPMILMEYIPIRDNLNNFDFKYDKETNGYKIELYNGSLKNIILPRKYNGKLITVIGACAFNYRTRGESWFGQLKGVKIPNGVVKIEAHAFSDNLIKKVKIPDSVKEIEVSAFTWNSFKKQEDIRLGKGFKNYWIINEEGVLQGHIGLCENYDLEIPNMVNNIKVKTLKGDFFLPFKFNSVKIGEGIEIENGYGFETYYEKIGRKAGIYKRRENGWVTN